MGTFTINFPNWSQNISYGFIGFFVKFFVNRSEMWWPEILPMVTMYRFVLAFEPSCVYNYLCLYSILITCSCQLYICNVGHFMRRRKDQRQHYQEINFSAWSLSLVFHTIPFRATSSLLLVHCHLFAGFGKGLSLLSKLALVIMVWGLARLALIGRQLAASLAVL